MTLEIPIHGVPHQEKAAGFGWGNLIRALALLKQSTEGAK